MADRWGYQGLGVEQYAHLSDDELRSEIARRLRVNAKLDDRPPAEVQLLRDVAALVEALNDADEG